MFGGAAIAVAQQWRLLDEEQLLTNSLPSYAAYKAKVKYRQIPFVW
jgi:protein-S-isoprenylcysteine O-methyltransferase Ste14